MSLSAPLCGDAAIVRRATASLQYCKLAVKLLFKQAYLLADTFRATVAGMANESSTPTTFRMEIELKALYSELAAEALRLGKPFPSMAKVLNDGARNELAELQKELITARRKKG